MALGRNIDRIEWNIESIESKFANIFKRPKNRKDGSDFDDFWTKLIASTRSVFRKNFRANVFEKFSRKLRETVVAGSVACAERRKFQSARAGD